MSTSTFTPPPAIGIIGGIGPQASTRLHRVIVDRATQIVHHDPGATFPEIIHYSVRVPPFGIPGPDQDEAIEHIGYAATTLARAGAVTIGLACNTAHILIPAVEESTGIALERIPTNVARVVREQGLSRVGLLATRTTIDEGLYDPVTEAAELVPSSPALTEEVSEYIHRVFHGRLTPDSIAQFQGLVEQFRIREHLDAVILGCTELPVAYAEGDRTGVLDSLDILADRLLENYLTAQRTLSALR